MLGLLAAISSVYVGNEGVSATLLGSGLISAGGVRGLLGCLSAQPGRVDFAPSCGRSSGENATWPHRNFSYMETKP